jgi:hypothetical protein
MDIQAWSIENWTRIPAADRKACLDHLRARILKAVDGPATLAHWRAQAASTLNGKPVEVGSDVDGFHFGAGMVIRNILRDVMTDDKLPGVEYPASGGEKGNPAHLARDWDDYYLGALHALATEPDPTPQERKTPEVTEPEAETMPIAAPDMADAAGFKTWPNCAHCGVRVDTIAFSDGTGAIYHDACVANILIALKKKTAVDTSDRPYYARALKALQAAHDACFNHPDRDLLGMSSGPFSGVNEALKIVDELETENKTLRSRLTPGTKVQTITKPEAAEMLRAAGVEPTHGQ